MPTFVDTNVLVYAHDRRAHVHERARLLVAELWREREGILSTQVLQELYVALTRKVQKPLRRTLAREVVRSYLAWPVRAIEPADVLAAAELEQRQRLSFWDALIVVAAREAGADRILSADFQPGRTIAGVAIENPFS